jgi:hypothetical protein
MNATEDRFSLPEDDVDAKFDSSDVHGRAARGGRSNFAKCSRCNVKCYGPGLYARDARCPRVDVAGEICGGLLYRAVSK